MMTLKKNLLSEDIRLTNYKTDQESINLSPLLSEEEKLVIEKFFLDHSDLKSKKYDNRSLKYEIGSEEFFSDEAWIQTFSGKRFTPTNPNYESIVIQDIAHALSMQCRFSGHVKKFYSVAQHSVLVSYLCDSKDALWGLLHDATEAYLVDIPRPLKRSGKFDAYLEFEKNMQTAICTRFGLIDLEPLSVKMADKIMLATEARDLMCPLRSDWICLIEPLPMKIEPMMPEDAESLFLERFYTLMKTNNI